MADDIIVQISAKLDQLDAGMKEAVNLIKGSLGEANRGMEDTGQASTKMEGVLKAALSGAVFLEFKQIAQEAMSAVRDAFEDTAGQAMRFGIENSKFAAMMGVTTTEAAGLSAALQGVGMTTREYQQMAMQMERRLLTQEGAMRSLGMATRDSNGDLLGGKALMDSAIATMLQYKQGTDQNAFALEIFGRRAADIYDVMRAGKTEQDAYIKDMKDLGVITDDTGKASGDLEAMLARQHQQWEDIQIAIGQRVTPVLIDFLKWMNNSVVVKDFGYALQFVADMGIAAATMFLEVGTVIGGVVSEIIDILGGLAIAIYDGITGNWSKIKGDVVHIWEDMKDSFAKTIKAMKDEAAGAQSIIDALAGKGPKEASGSGQSIVPKGGSKKFVTPNTAASGEERKLQEQAITDFEKLSLDQIKIEEDKNAHMLAMGQRTADQFEAIAEHLEQRKFAIQQSALEARLSEDQKAEDAAKALGAQGYTQLAEARLAKQKDMDALQDLAVNHEGALNRIREQGELRRAELSRQELAQSLQDDDARLQSGIAEAEEAYKTNQISADQRAMMERGLTTTIRSEQLARLDGELATLQRGTTQWNEAYKQRQKIVDDFAKGMQKIDNQLQTEQMQKWQQLSTTIRGSFNSALNGMIIGTTSWRQALGQLVNGVAEAFLNMGEKILEDQAERWAISMLMDKTNTTTSALSQISAAAGVAGANAFAATSAIPYVGPELAPGVAAAAVTSTLSFSSLAFAEQGMLLDRDRLVFAHKDEQILPPHLSRGIQSMIKGGGPGGGAHLHYSPTINAPERPTLAGMLEEESHTMMAWVNARIRDGSLKSASGGY